MEYIVGVSLEDRIQRTGHLRVEEILRIGMQAASGLAAAHAQGLVHRDIKPSNILLENGIERVKITDFGLARVIHEAQATQSNVVTGTPPYMSPEQTRGETVDHRSDLFSLGCVLYAMCVGRSPFRADTPTGAMHRVCEDTPRPIREINPDIPDWLVAVIDRLLEKKPDDRFQSPTEVAEVLGQYLAHVQQPSQVALPADRRAIGISQRQRHVWPWLAASGGLLALILLTVIVSRWSDNPPGPIPALRQQGEDESRPKPGEKPSPRFTFVDITEQAKQSLSQPPAPNVPEGTLAELEREISNGVLAVGDIPIRVNPRYMQLEGEHVPGCPQAVRGIKLNCTGKTVHILHGCAWVQDGSTKPVASYTFHYEDGTSAVMPVIQGRHLRDWWSRSSLPEQATCATRAWTGTNPVVAKAQRKLQIFLCSWVNPYPTKMITSIDFERGTLKSPAPFCLGITCDQEATPKTKEPGLVIVDIGQYAGNNRYSVAIGNSPGPSLRGVGQHNVLLPPGRHCVEVRDGETIVRRGSIEVSEGGIAFVILDAQSTFLALPTPQPDPRCELTGQIWGIFDCALSHDGKTLATAAGDGTVVLWKREGDSWKKLATLDLNSSLVWAVAFSPTASLLASAGNDGTLSLWDSESAVPVATLKRDEQKVSAVAFSPDGKTLASGNGDGTVDLWNVATQEKIATLAAHSGIVAGLAFSADGKALATSSWQDNDVKVWEVTSRQLKQVLSGHTSKIGSVAFSPNGKLIASASSDTTVRLWDAETGQPIKSFANPDRMYRVAFSPDGKQLAAGGFFQTVRIWDLASLEVIHDFVAHWAEVRSLTYTPDGATLITSGWDNSTRAWSVVDLPGPFGDESNSPRPKATFKIWEDWTVWAAFTPKAIGDKVATVQVAGGCQIWDINERTATTFEAYTNESGVPFGWMCQDSLHFTPDGKGFVTCVTRKKGQPHIGLWQTNDYGLRDTFDPGPLPSRDFMEWDARMILSHDGAMVGIASPQQGRVTAVDIVTRSPLWSVQLRNGLPSSISIAPDDRTISVGTSSGRVLLLDAKTGKDVHQPLQHGTGLVTAVAFAPDRTSLISAGKDGVLNAWDLTSYESQTLSAAHDEKITCVGFSPDGKVLVTTGGAWMMDKDILKRHGEVCLWDVANRKLLTKFTAHYGSVTCGVFSPDGKSLATTGRDGKMHLWDVADLLKPQVKTEAK